MLIRSPQHPIIIHSEAGYFLPGAKLMEKNPHCSVFYIIVTILCIYVELFYVVLHNSSILLSTVSLATNGLSTFPQLHFCQTLDQDCQQH